MNTPGAQMNIVQNQKNRLNSNLKKFEQEIKKSVRMSCRDNFNDYLENSTLHSLRYVGDRTITRFERTFFTLMFFLVIALSFYFISILWIKWTVSPMIVSISSKTLAVQDLPFPAVTICNMNQVRKSAIKKFPEHSPEFGVVKSICKPDSIFRDNTSVHSGKWTLYRRILWQVYPPCEDMLLYCEYGGINFTCMNRFRTVASDSGLCCTFNQIHEKFLIRDPHYSQLGVADNLNLIAHRWTPEDGFYPKTEETDTKAYPLPAFGSGNELGLTLYLKTDMKDYFCSSTKSYGFKVLLHSPNDLPKVSQYGIAIPSGYETRIVINPILSDVTDEVRQLPRRIRQCVFENENFLQFYLIYSEKNCESECETRAVLANCGCVMYYMPRLYSNVSICGYEKTDCAEQISRQIQFKQNSSFKCEECLPGCYAINYDDTFSTAKLFDETPFLIQNDLDPSDVAFLHIYYSKSTFRTQKKDELVGFTDFLSNMGGLLGLFMGFSFISVIEIFYFATIRPYCNHLRLSMRRKELISKLTSKVDNLRLKRDTPIIVAMDSNSHHDKELPHPYLE